MERLMSEQATSFGPDATRCGTQDYSRDANGFDLKYQLFQCRQKDSPLACPWRAKVYKNLSEGQLSVWVMAAHNHVPAQYTFKADEKLPPSVTHRYKQMRKEKKTPSEASLQLRKELLSEGVDVGKTAQQLQNFTYRLLNTERSKNKRTKVAE